MRAIVCGGRSYNDDAFVRASLDKMHGKHVITTIIQGGAKGADMHAANWGWDNNIPVATFNADWSVHGKKAGPLRNQRMIDEACPDCLVAFPGGAGTADMLARAKAAGLKIWKP